MDKIILFESADKTVKLDVPMQDDSVWLNRQQLATLFGRDVKTIGKHVNNALLEELDGDNSTVANFATVQIEGSREVRRLVEYYNLDVIISVGYRVKSQRGVEFRRWANKVLKDYILKGYAVNQNRLMQLSQVVEIMKSNETSLDSKQILSVIEQYTNALDLLDDYDHQRIKKPAGSSAVYIITYEECKALISQMRFGSESELFGIEKDDSFHGSISNIYQSFSGVEIYPSVEEKAANLLYFVTKNHSFSDGNKRIAAAVFLYFLDKNGILFRNDTKRIADHTLVAIIIMIAESRPDEKEIMIKLVMNFLAE